MESLLTGKDLIDKKSNGPKDFPSVGVREFKPDNSWLENKQIQVCLEDKLSLLSSERIEKLANLAKAEWHPDLQKAKVLKKIGKHWEVFGHSKDNVEWLLPEEALFLLEINVLQLFYGDVPVSIEQSYVLLLGKTCTLNEYRVFSFLSKRGYKVLRHNKEVTCTRYEKQVHLDQVVEAQKRPPPVVVEESKEKESSEDIVITVSTPPPSVVIENQTKETLTVDKISPQPKRKISAGKQDGDLYVVEDEVEIIEIEDNSEIQYLPTQKPKKKIETLIIIESDEDSDSDIVVVNNKERGKRLSRKWYLPYYKCLLPTEIVDLSDDDNSFIVKSENGFTNMDYFDLGTKSRYEILKEMLSVMNGVTIINSPDRRFLPKNIEPKHSMYRVNLSKRDDLLDLLERPYERQSRGYRHNNYNSSNNDDNSRGNNSFSRGKRRYFNDSDYQRPDEQQNFDRDEETVIDVDDQPFENESERNYNRNERNFNKNYVQISQNERNYSRNDQNFRSNQHQNYRRNQQNDFSVGSNQNFGQTQMQQMTPTLLPTQMMGANLYPNMFANQNQNALLKQACEMQMMAVGMMQAVSSIVAAFAPNNPMFQNNQMLPINNLPNPFNVSNTQVTPYQSNQMGTTNSYAPPPVEQERNSYSPSYNNSYNNSNNGNSNNRPNYYRPRNRGGHFFRRRSFRGRHSYPRPRVLPTQEIKSPSPQSDIIVLDSDDDDLESRKYRKRPNPPNPKNSGDKAKKARVQQVIDLSDDRSSDAQVLSPNSIQKARTSIQLESDSSGEDVLDITDQVKKEKELADSTSSAPHKSKENDGQEGHPAKDGPSGWNTIKRQRVDPQENIIEEESIDSKDSIDKTPFENMDLCASIEPDADVKVEVKSEIKTQDDSTEGFTEQLLVDDIKSEAVKEELPEKEIEVVKNEKESEPAEEQQSSEPSSWAQYKEHPIYQMPEIEPVQPLIDSHSSTDLEQIWGSLQIFQPIDKLVGKGRELTISFDVYLPADHFKKSLKTFPKFRIIVASGSDPFPTRYELEVLKSKYQDDVQLLYAIVFEESIGFYNYEGIRLSL